jgi:hypothetical protein
MSLFSQFGGGGGGAFIGDVKYKALHDLNVTFETADGVEWLRAGWTVPWNAKYAQSVAAYGSGLSGYLLTDLMPQITGTASLNTPNPIQRPFTSHWDGSRFHIVTEGSGAGPAVSSMSTVGGAINTTTHTTLTAGGGALAVGMAVSPGGGVAGQQVVAIATNGSASAPALLRRINLGTWGTVLTTQTGGPACVASNFAGTLWVFASGWTPSQIFTSPDGVAWTARTATGPGFDGNAIAWIQWSSVLARFLMRREGSSDNFLVSTTDGFTLNQETLPGGHTVLRTTAHSRAFAESPTAVMMVAMVNGLPALIRNTGSGWVSQAMPGPSPGGLHPSIAFCGGAFYVQRGNRFWRSTDNGLTFQFFGYASGLAASGFIAGLIDAAGGQLFIADASGSNSLYTVRYFQQAAPSATPDVFGHPVQIFQAPGGGSDVSYGFVRIF